ncbi:Aste57867_13073 [Aphanomyces stellatus]|uniref:Aste57867_13073 protein n=1 Tax=Aphanomyces stellatus TaxID=120398 RepID=A0A485KXN6_9STRA|nr:hypothetical protein As57867_013025 [Aphanomyces stellatus]VFT89917.1 Aste57867_13073 [Aphanomyces stellatus]
MLPLPPLVHLVGAALAWTNWDTHQVCYPQQHLHPTSPLELQLAVAGASSVRVAGTGHSFSPIVLTNATLLSLDRLASVVSYNRDTITVQGGMPLYAINQFLAADGRALPNLGAVSVQTAAGATQTATHGTGRTGSLSTGITAMDLVVANGTMASVRDGDLLDAARVGMGVFGVVSTLTLQHVPLWTMEQITFSLPRADFQAHLRQLQATYDRLQWFIYGDVAAAQSVTIVLRVNSTHPIAPQGGCWGGATFTPPTTPPPSFWSIWPADAAACVDVSYKTLGVVDSGNTYRFTEMELMIPAEDDLAALADAVQVHALQSLSRPLFLGMRYVDADSIWLSPFFGRRTAVVSSILHSQNDGDDDDGIAPRLHAALHAAMTKYNARPHPGKVNYFTAADMRRVYPKFQAFVALQKAIDPTGKFLNPYMRMLLDDEARTNVHHGSSDAALVE